MAEKRPIYNPSQEMFYNDFEIYKYKKENNSKNQEDLHHHDFYEIFFFLEGQQDYVVEDKVYSLFPGDILLISPSELHQAKMTLSNEVFTHIVLWINKKFLERISSKENILTNCFDLSQNNHSNLIRVPPKKFDEINAIANLMIEESASDDNFSYEASRAYLKILMIYINRLAKSDSFKFINYQENKLIKDVISYINQNFDKNISLESISADFFVSKYHLSRTFQKHMDTGLHKYLTSKRLQRAKEVLQKPPYPKDIYKICGFGDYTSFYRSFKNVYGISPNEYSKQFR